METGRGMEGRADQLLAQVEWKGMCLDNRGMIVAPSDDMGASLCLEMPLKRTTKMFLWSGEGLRAGRVRLMI